MFGMVRVDASATGQQQEQQDNGEFLFPQSGCYIKTSDTKRAITTVCGCACDCTTRQMTGEEVQVTLSHQYY